MTSNQPRDWDKEMAEIDKIMAKAPAAQLAPGKAVAAAPSGGAPPRSAAPASAPVTRGGAFSTWLRVGLGVALAAGMTQWPYFHACGPSLFLYLGAIGVVGLSGLWGMVSSWRRRMGIAHSFALAVFLWGLVLAAASVLPRIGYAKLGAVWMCP